MIDRETLTKLLCVAFVAAIMVPLGSWLLPMSATSQDFSFRR